MIKKYPFYLKSTVILLGLMLLGNILFNLREILVPLSFGLILAILLNPITVYFEKLKFPRMLAITVALLLAIVFIVSIFYFLYSEISGLSTELPAFKTKFSQLFINLQKEINDQLGINAQKQNEYIGEAQNGLKPYLANAMGSAFGTITTFILLPVYAFLFLFYRTLILNFLYDVFADENAKEVRGVLVQTKGAIQNYMFGLILEAIIVGILNCIALLILGVKYAILLGFLGAIINVLPFVGGIVAVLLPVLIATVTKDGYQTQLGIVIIYVIIQFIDNHFLIPYIVSSKVKINALISIIIVLLGGALWGVSGMFLSIPFTGILKIIFDRIPELKPWGKLLGEEIPTTKPKSTKIQILKKTKPPIEEKKAL